MLAPIEVDANDSVVSLYAYFNRESRVITLKAIAPRSDIAQYEYAGRFYSDELDTFWDLEITEDVSLLKVSCAKSEDNWHQPIAPDHFGTGGLLVGVSIRFRRDQSGQVCGFTYSTGRLDGIDFERH